MSQTFREALIAAAEDVRRLEVERSGAVERRADAALAASEEGGMKVGEIALTMGVTHGRVSQLLQQARRRRRSRNDDQAA